MDNETKRILEDHEKRLKFIENILKQSQESPETTKNSENILSFQEFASRFKDLTKYEDKAAIIIYYLWRYNNDNFSLSKLSEYNKKVGWESYSNTTVLIKRLKEKHYIEKDKKDVNGNITYRMLLNCKEFIENKLREGDTKINKLYGD